ncbi:MAG TPA: peptidoglycan editing factor PgeF [Candidatus Saccharimonadales bacterium]|nr:peptidoglycan editing factor PgeF [Candidatus Saccharimonadales bacterium]
MPRPRKSSPKPKRRAGHPLSRAPEPGKVSSPWTLGRSRGLQILQLAPFSKLPWLVHGFSTRVGGFSSLDGERLLNLGFMEWDTPENVNANRKKFQAALGADDLTLAPLKQIHSSLLYPFAAVPPRPCKGDASSTNTPGLLLAVQTADCVPILLVDPKKRAVAAIHAGWKGTLARITEKAVGRMRYEYGSKAAHLLAAIGPSVGSCCYEVAADFVSKFTAQFADAAEYFDEARSGEEPNPLQWLNMAPPGHQPPPKGVHLDLRKANRSQLLAAGLRPQNIFVSDLCTACRTDLFFSYRKEGALSGRLMSVVGIRSK